MSSTSNPDINKTIPSDQLQDIIEANAVTLIMHHCNNLLTKALKHAFSSNYEDEKDIITDTVIKQAENELKETAYTGPSTFEFIMNWLPDKRELVNHKNNCIKEKQDASITAQAQTIVQATNLIANGLGDTLLNNKDLSNYTDSVNYKLLNNDDSIDIEHMMREKLKQIGIN